MALYDSLKTTQNKNKKQTCSPFLTHKIDRSFYATCRDHFTHNAGHTHTHTHTQPFLRRLETYVNNVEGVLLLCAFPVVQSYARDTKKSRQKVHPVLPQHILLSSSTHTLSRSLALFVAHLTIKLTTLSFCFHVAPDRALEPPYRETRFSNWRFSIRPRCAG